MNAKIKIRQHYVPRKYLEAFSNPKVFCLQKNNFFSTTPDNIACEKFFYEFTPLNKGEILIIQNGLINLIKDSTLKNHAQKWLDFCIEISANMKLLDSMTEFITTKKEQIPDKTKIFSIEGETLEHVLDKAKEFGRTEKVNLIEDELALIEGETEKKVLSQLRNLDITVLNDENNKLLLLEYMFTQYFRTKKVRKIMTEAMREVRVPINFKNIDFDLIHLISIKIYAFNAACINLQDNFFMLKNDTSIPFITSDQPIINLSAEDKNEQGEVKSDDLYMPITPKIAILKLKNDTSVFFDDINNLTSKDIKFLNDKIAENKLSFLFASSKSILDYYK